MEWIMAVVALGLGLLLGWFAALSRSRAGREDLVGRAQSAQAQADELRKQVDSSRAEAAQIQTQMRQIESDRTAAQTRCGDMETSMREQKLILEEAKAKLSDTFKSLAADALKSSNQDFLTLAKQVLGSLQKEGSTDLESRRKAVEDLVRPLQETLEAYQKESRTLEERRLREHGAVAEQLRSLAEANIKLQSETGKLVNALSTPQVRGRWGEITLRRCAELAGMSVHCDFVEQMSVATEDGRLRPDMVVNLPSGHKIVVDSKVPFDAYWASQEAKSDAERDKALLHHAQVIRQHVSQLSAKEYWDQFKSAPEFVVLFIPNESFLGAAVDKDLGLMEAALEKRIVISTPAIFIALLRAVAYGWKQERLSENAQIISRLGQELHERMSTLAEHLAEIGKSLGRSVESYNAAVASIESRVFPSARKFKALGAGSKKDIGEIAALDQSPRRIELPSEDRT